MIRLVTIQLTTLTAGPKTQDTRRMHVDEAAGSDSASYGDGEARRIWLHAYLAFASCMCLRQDSYAGERVRRVEVRIGATCIHVLCDRFLRTV